MKKPIFFVASLLVIMAMSNALYASEVLVFFGGITATTYKLESGQRPFPVYEEGDCAGGPLACRVALFLSDLPLPPHPLANTVNEMGDRTFQYQTRSGKLFSARLHMRRTDSAYGASLLCVNPDKNTSVSSDLSNGPVMFVALNCPDFKQDENHIIRTKIQLSIKQNSDFGYLR